MTDIPNEIAKRVAGVEILRFPRHSAPASVQAFDAEPPSASRPAQDRASARTVREDDGSGGSGDGPGQTGAARDRELGLLPLTDLGNAERFVRRYPCRLLYCGAIGWLAWDGRRWKRDGDGKAVALAEQATARAIQAESKAVSDSDADYAIDVKRGLWLSSRIAAWGRTSEAASRLTAISRLAAARLSVDLEELDADPMRINLLNGTLTVRKAAEGPYAVLHPHNSADLITKICPVAYRADAICPLYDALLARVQPDATMRRFLHQWFGLSLTGDVGEQKFAFLYGRGRNGKGVLVNLMRHIAGDYAAWIGIESFLDSGRARAGGQATPDLAVLPGVRLLSTSEPKKGSALDDGLIKLFTGGDPIKARHLNRDFFEFQPQAKLTMQGNFRPKIGDTSEGMWARVLLTPFPVIIPKEERDPKLEEKLRVEATGVLLRLVDGLTDWLDNGLLQPEAVVDATAQYRADSDPFKRYEDTCIRRKDGSRVQASDMHALYAAWAKANGESVWSPKGLNNTMTDRDYRTIKSGGLMHWMDVELVARVGDFIDANGNTVHRRPGDDGAAQERND